MTDTTAPTPSPWLALLQALTPSLNQAVTGIAGAIVGILTTLGTQWATAAPPPPPPAPPVHVQKVETTKVIVDPVLVDVLKDLTKEVGALQKEVSEGATTLSGRVQALEAQLAAMAAARKARAAVRAPTQKSGS